MDKNRNFKSAKHQLTVMLPKEIHYGHTIDEAEKVDAISDAMELYAEEKGIEFALYIAENGWRNIGNSEWSNGEIHRTTSEIYNMCHAIPTKIDDGLNVVLDNKHENNFKFADEKRDGASFLNWVDSQIIYRERKEGSLNYNKWQYGNLWITTEELYAVFSGVSTVVSSLVNNKELDRGIVKNTFQRAVNEVEIFNGAVSFDGKFTGKVNIEPLIDKIVNEINSYLKIKE